MVPATPHGSASSSKRVLVVDDHQPVRTMLGKVMETMGFAVDVADSGEAALPFLGVGHYDAVLCDLVMPGMSGDQLFGACQQRHPEVARRFVFLSGSPGGTASSDSARATGQPFLAKPCRLTDVKAAIARVATSNPPEASGRPSTHGSSSL